MDGPEIDLVVHPVGPIGAIPAPVGQWVPRPRQAGTNLRVDSGHHRFRQGQVGHRRGPGVSRGRPLEADRHGTDPDQVWAGCPAPGCVVVPTRRDALALVHLVNWVAADTQSSAVGPAQLLDSEASPGLIRLDPRALGLAGLALLVGEQTDANLPAGLAPTLVERASLQPGADWWAADLRGRPGQRRFRAFHGGEFRAEVALGAGDADLILPCLAALAVGVHLGLAASLVADRLGDCPAVARRFEFRGGYCGASLVDDDALGPGGVAGALALARVTFGRRPIRAVWLPHADPVLRGMDWADEWAAALPEAGDLGEADHLILVVGELRGAESARLLAATLRSSGASVVLCSSLGGAIRELDRTLGPGDVILTLGADAVGMIADALLRRLARDRHY